MHTKGPWKVATITETQLPAVVQVDGPVIAEITEWGSVGTVDLATAWDNARLIAAAPELLEALESIALTADQSGLDSQSTYDGVLEDIHEATQEAIRKAKGE